MLPTLKQSLFAMINKFRWTYLKGVVMIMIANGLLILNPLLFRRAVMDVQSKAALLPLWIWIFTLVFVASTAAFFKYWMRFTFITTSRFEEEAVRNTLFDRIQKQSMAFFDCYGIGELLSRLTNDVTAFRDVLGPGVMYPLFFITLVGPGMFALFYISPLLGLISFVPLALIPLINFFVRSGIYRESTTVQALLGNLSTLSQEVFSSIRIIKAHAAENRLDQRFSELSQQMIPVRIRLSIFQGLLFPFFLFLTRVITISLVIVSGGMILEGWGELTTADFVSFMWIQSYIFFPVLMLGWLLPVFERGRAAYDRLYEIYQAPIEVVDQSTANIKIKKGANIELRNLSFTYPNKKSQVLHSLFLSVKGGSFIGIAGPIGAGKSTLLKLLNREYEVPFGTIFIDQRDIHEYPLEEFHQHLVAVEQVPFLFSRTIRENVSFGKPDAPMQEIVQVTEFADVFETIYEFPEAFETLVGERGVTLSGGQKQRIAIARALLVDRSILLLDDIFSAVDSKTEKKILQSIKTQLKGKTILLISHRISVLEEMDEILYLQEGRLLEQGTPAVLKKQKGHYSALFELQQMILKR